MIESHIVQLCHNIGPCKLSAFLEQTFDPHYPFKKSDWEKLFGRIPLSHMKKLGEEAWFDFRSPERLQLSMELHQPGTFCICMNTSKISHAPFMLIISARCSSNGRNVVEQIKLDCHITENDLTFFFPIHRACLKKSVIDIISSTGQPPNAARSLLELDAGQIANRLAATKRYLSNTDIGMTNRLNMLKWYSSFILFKHFAEQYFVHDWGAKFRNRWVLKGSIVIEIISDLVGNDDKPIIFWCEGEKISIIQNFLKSSTLYKMWLIGIASMSCLPKELIDMIRMIFVRPLFI
jgi:hypothetical protein